MYHFLETIKVTDGVCLPGLHFDRIQNACRQYYGREKNLEEIEHYLLNLTDAPGVHKLSIHYNIDQQECRMRSYNTPNIKSLMAVVDDTINYSLKYLDRSRLDKYREMAGEDADCLIIKNNRPTDSSFANLAFWTGSEWHTPAQPLLKGTKRSLLLKQKRLTEKDILISDLHQYQKISLINAMLELGEVEVDTADIKLSGS